MSRCHIWRKVTDFSKIAPFDVDRLYFLYEVIFAEEKVMDVGTLKTELLTQRLPASNYMFKVNNRNTRIRCEICSKLAIKIPERRLVSTLIR